MKKYSLIALMVLFSVSFWNCEKDDLCAEATPTTPRVVIEFYDTANPTTLKNVTNLGIIAPGFTEGLSFNGVSEIVAPLKTSDDVTILNFIQNGSDEDDMNDNSDQIIFNYTRKDIYISRACGYKTIFTFNDVNGVELQTDTDNWIQSITVENTSIDNENETHVKIYF
ncbi:DUF6452 family protein [Flavobacterium sp. HNIBRBA15423]|uniref:DUF6452 family protein n=1 Tax=Flavobacterium sp. HNIBRBA15423 TaxID=3458683 RepID=UPI004043BCC5